MASLNSFGEDEYKKQIFVVSILSKYQLSRLWDEGKPEDRLFHLAI